MCRVEQCINFNPDKSYNRDVDLTKCRAKDAEWIPSAIGVDGTCPVGVKLSLAQKEELGLVSEGLDITVADYSAPLWVDDCDYSYLVHFKDGEYINERGTKDTSFMSVAVDIHGNPVRVNINATQNVMMYFLEKHRSVPFIGFVGSCIAEQNTDFEYDEQEALLQLAERGEIARENEKRKTQIGMPIPLPYQHVRVGETESVNFHHVDAVAQDLCQRVPLERKNEITCALPIAKALMEKLKLHASLDQVNYDNVHLWEATYLMLAVAHRWQRAEGTSTDEKKDLAQIIALIFPQGIRKRKSPEIGRQSNGVYPGVLGLLVAECYPDTFPYNDHGTGRKPSETLTPSDRGRYLRAREVDREYIENTILENARDMHADEDGILVLPFEDPFEANEAIGRCFDELGVPEQNRSFFAGVMCSKHALIIHTTEPDELCKNHEEEHYRNDGIEVGGTGESLTEACTQYLALKKTYPGNDPFYRVGESRYSSCYSEDLTLLKVLFDERPCLKSSLIERYKLRTLENAQDLASKLIAAYGLDGYLDRVLPS